MGWSYAIDDSRAEGDQDIGYSIQAKCDLDGCEVDIDRGLAYVCGGDPYGGEHGCGKFFCYSHLAWYSYWTEDGTEYASPQMCPACGAEWEKKGLSEQEYYDLQDEMDEVDAQVTGIQYPEIDENKINGPGAAR